MNANSAAWTPPPTIAIRSGTAVIEARVAAVTPSRAIPGTAGRAGREPVAMITASDSTGRPSITARVPSNPAEAPSTSTPAPAVSSPSTSVIVDWISAVAEKSPRRSGKRSPASAPRDASRRASARARAASFRALTSMQPYERHCPPSVRRSTSRTGYPADARCMAANRPAGPPPITVTGAISEDLHALVHGG